MTPRTRRLLGPALMTAAMLVVLIGLGSWQLHRLAWKTTLLAQIDRAEALPPVPLTPQPAPFAKLSVSGTFDYGQAVLYGAEVRPTLSGTAMGARMIVPLRRDSGEIVLIDRGWAPLARRRLDEPRGAVTVEGYARYSEPPGWFSAPDDPPSRRFYTWNTPAIGKALGLADPPPFVLVALSTAAAAPDQWPAPARHLPRPPNNHFSYALTWYGLAVALVAIFIVWARRERAHEKL